MKQEIHKNEPFCQLFLFSAFLSEKLPFGSEKQGKTKFATCKINFATCTDAKCYLQNGNMAVAKSGKRLAFFPISPPFSGDNLPKNLFSAVITKTAIRMFYFLMGIICKDMCGCYIMQRNKILGTDYAPRNPCLNLRNKFLYFHPATSAIFSGSSALSVRLQKRSAPAPMANTGT